MFPGFPTGGSVRHHGSRPFSNAPSQVSGEREPSRIRRTVRDNLPSYGSHNPTSGGSGELPVLEEEWIVLACLGQPLPTPAMAYPAAVELLHGPSDEVLVDASVRKDTTRSDRRLRNN